MSVLSGRFETRANAPVKISAHVELNGSRVYQRSQRLAARVAFVPAHDLGLTFLTVREAFEESAALQLAHLSAQERQSRIARAIQNLNLQHAYSRRLNVLSGGERRRVSVGLSALLLDKPIIFLDEPTSGPILYYVVLFFVCTSSYNPA